MRLEFLPFPFLAGLGILVTVSVIVWHKNRNVSYLICCILFGLYLLVLTGLTLFPMPVSSPVERQSVTSILSRINLVPFRFGRLFSLHPNVISYEILGNIVLTIPFGFGIIFIAPKTARRIVGWVPGIGFAIEFTQLLASIATGFSYRGIDINDVILNDLGALIGFGLFRLFAWIFLYIKHRFGIKPEGLFAYIDDVIHKSV
ncbi:MAG: VanZ family protein [Chloroflexi bacterium]|nr:VanZ family protein [Chloroflexota bacterium]